MTSSPKYDPGRLAHLKRVSDEKLALSRAAFGAFREVADQLTAARRAIEQAEAEIEMAYPSLRPYLMSKLTETRASVDRLLTERDAAQRRSDEASEAAQIAGRLHAACREYAISQGLISHPQGGFVQKETAA